MGHPAYEARREAERLEAEQELAPAKAGKAAFEALTDWLQGRAAVQIIQPIDAQGWYVRLVRDQ